MPPKADSHVGNGTELSGDLPNYLYDDGEPPRILATPKHSAYIKIAGGL